MGNLGEVSWTHCDMVTIETKEEKERKREGRKKEGRGRKGREKT